MYERWNEPAGWPAGVLTDADRRRFARYADALAFFDGEQWTGRARRGETRLTFNYARALIRKIAAYVYPAPVAFNVPIPEGSGIAAETANRAERILAATAAELDLGRLDVDLCIDAAILGDAAIKVTWDGRAGRPVVAPVDSATLAVACAADDPRRAVRVTQAYALPASALADLGLTVGATGRLLAFPGSDWRAPGEAGESLAPIVETWTAERWRLEAAGQIVRDEANPYGWIPYAIAPNNPRPSAFWGESDLADLYDVCRELNARLSVLSKVLEVSGSPVAVLENVDGSEGIAVGPGAKWELPEGAKAYLLDLLSGGGVGLHVQFVDLLYRALHDLSETPRTAFGDAGRNLSGAALEVEIQPLVQKVGRKRRQWEAFHWARNGRLLDLLERFGGEPLAGLRRTETIWPPILPSDVTDAVRNATQLTAAGIQSRRTAAAALGNDDPEREWADVLAEMTALREVGESGSRGVGE
ncbi:MAG TPA: phage portal protein, partial [Thermomicrobiales bacterium]|nr:phage portal protein [Thermomicrobiales bacterium]